MKRSSVIKALLIIGIIIFLGFIIWAFESRISKNASHPLNDKPFNPYPIDIKGINHTIYEDNRLVAQIKADEIKINPRKFYIFNISTLNELTVINADFEVYLYPDIKKNGIFPFTNNILPVTEKQHMPKEFGLITRGIIKGLSLKAHRSNKPFLIVKAANGYIDFKNKRIILEKASVEEISSGKRIISDSIVWDQKGKVFKIRDEYLAVTPKGKASGRGVQFNLDFVFTPLS
jgi:hypothetical protein